MPVLALAFESGLDTLSVRRFVARESLSSPFRVDVWAVSPDQDIDLRAIVGKRAELHVVHGTAHVAALGERTFRGVCSAMAQTRVEPTGLATYELTIVPAFALLGHRRDHRIFQHESAPDIVKEILDAWGIRADFRIEREKYPPLEMRVQHGESDLHFVSRLLEEAGITYLFEDGAPDRSITLLDRPHAADARPGGKLPFVDNPSRAAEKEFVTAVEVAREVRPGARAVRDHDLRNPGYPVSGAAQVDGPEKRLEQYGYAPGAFLVEGQKPSNTPVADTRGVARHSEPFARDSTARALAADRTGDRRITYATNAVDLRPGAVFSIDHPHSQATDRRLLATDLTIEGTPDQEWRVTGSAVLAEQPYRPPRRTPKPRALGLTTALVTGPPGEEIHTDEFGRVRVRFPWDRGPATDDRSSCWLRVSQAWAGAGFGWTAIPRVGQEVIVAFFEDDPDQPVILAGAHNGASPAPHLLPPSKTAGAWRSRSTPGGGGDNEILVEDATGKEVLHLQAERDMTLLARRNEAETTLRNRSKLVKGDESETTGKDRTDVTRQDREKLVKGDHAARIEGSRAHTLRKGLDVRVEGSTHAAVGGDASVVLHGEDRVKIGGTESAQSGADRHEVIFKRHAVEAASDIHLASDDSAVIEGFAGITLKTPGGFVLLDAGGIVIKGTLVKINSGGVAGHGGGSRPEAPAPPREVEPFDPPMPYGEPNPDGDEPPPVEIEEAPPPIEKGPDLTWIEIVLKDADDQPVAGERYRVITPDGKVREGHLGSDGRARVEGIVPGECQVTFPDLDQDDWS
jgi:type VI secretion system secreted protein VgrG